MMVGTYMVPTWYSAVAFIITAIMAFSGFQMMGKK
jgi:hypothetical protein